MTTAKKSAPKKTTSKPLSRVLKTRLKKLAVHAEYSIDESHKITITHGIPTYITGLMLMSRVVVLATVLGVEPQFTLTNTSLKIVIGSSKHVLTEHDIELAERLAHQLSTATERIR